MRKAPKDVARFITNKVMEIISSEAGDTPEELRICSNGRVDMRLSEWLNENFRFTVGAEEKIIATKVDPELRKQIKETADMINKDQGIRTLEQGMLSQYNFHKFMIDAISKLNEHENKIKELEEKIKQ